ncbi:hypothetical protein ACJJTC_004582 [Scirpophaga incertulas]
MDTLNFSINPTPSTTTLASSQTDNRSQINLTTTASNFTQPIEDDVFHDVMDELFLANSDGNPMIDVLNRIVSHAITIPKILTNGKSISKANKLDAIRHAETIKKLAESLITNSKEKTNNIITPSSSQNQNQNTLNKETVKAIEDTIKRTIKQCNIANTHAPSTSHANVTKSTAKRDTFPSLNPAITTNKNSNPAIIVTVNGSTNKEITRKTWREEISFRKENFLPTKITNVNDNKLKIEFDSTIQLNRTLDLITQNKNKKLMAEKVKKLQPMFILKGIPKTVDSKDLISLLVIQNKCLEHLNPENTKPHLKLCFQKNNRNVNLYNAVFRATPEIWNKVLEIGRLNIDHSKVYVGEHIAILHCFKCLQYGHTTNKCQNEEHNCSHCSSIFTHSTMHRNDKSVIKCHNCVKNNKKFNKKNPTNHSATSNQCPIKQAVMAKATANTDYGTK